jgi:hypothetical protein
MTMSIVPPSVSRSRVPKVETASCCAADGLATPINQGRPRSPPRTACKMGLNPNQSLGLPKKVANGSAVQIAPSRAEPSSKAVLG